MRRVNSSTIWMWLGILILGSIAILRVQAALAPEDASAARRERREAAAEAIEETETVLTHRSYDRGDCVTWDQAGSWEDTDVVDCGEEHLLEVVGRIDHPAKADDPYPTAEEWNLFYEERCGPMVDAYLDGRWDRHGILGAGGLRPVPSSWTGAAHRTVWCGVSGAKAGPVVEGDQLPVLRGRAADLDQSWVHLVGACLEAVDLAVLEVPCEQPHHFLVVGELDLSPLEARPSTEEIQTLCAEAVGRVQGEGGRFVTNVGFDPQSWEAGSRRGTCVLGVFDESGAPVLQQPGALRP